MEQRSPKGPSPLKKNGKTVPGGEAYSNRAATHNFTVKHTRQGLKSPLKQNQKNYFQISTLRWTGSSNWGPPRLKNPFHKLKKGQRNPPEESLLVRVGLLEMECQYAGWVVPQRGDKGGGWGNSRKTNKRRINYGSERRAAE